jgi:molecular chaperone GrpE
MAKEKQHTEQMEEEDRQHQLAGESAQEANDLAEMNAESARLQDDLEQMEQEIARLQDETRALNDQRLRVAAEFQNYRRRSEEALQHAVERGRAEVLTPMLGVLDDLRRSIEAAEKAAESEAGSPALQSLMQGIDLVFRKFTAEAGRFGVEAMEAVGQPFDENLHEALMQQPAPDGVEPGTVIAEAQKGYRMGDRVLRHAQVIVAR